MECQLIAVMKVPNLGGLFMPFFWWEFATNATFPLIADSSHFLWYQGQGIKRLQKNGDLDHDLWTNWWSGSQSNSDQITIRSQKN